jgi:hypothetical protein
MPFRSSIAKPLASRSLVLCRTSIRRVAVERVRQVRLMPGALHLIHDPVITATGFQSDFRSSRQFLQKFAEHLKIMSHPDWPPYSPFSSMKQIPKTSFVPQ